MKMKLFILITCILFCLPDSSLAIRWLSAPGEMQACTGDDVTFHWEYDTQDERVSLINIINAKTEKTFLSYHFSEGISKVFDDYKGRTLFIENSQESTKFTLKNVTKADAVGYMILLGGPGEKNLANLKVYNSLELEPTLHVNNKLHEFRQPLKLTSDETPALMLLTAQSEPATITIFTGGDTLETCFKSTACTHSLSDHSVEYIGFNVEYEVCGMIEVELSVVSESSDPEPSDGNETFVTGTIQTTHLVLIVSGGVVLLAGIIAVTVILVIKYRR